MAGHWQILGGHPGGMGPRKKRKGQYSPFVDYTEPKKWRKKMDIGKGSSDELHEHISKIFEKIIREAFEELQGPGTKTPKRPGPVEPDVDPDVDPDAPPEDQPFDPFDPNPAVDPMPKAEDEDRLMEGGPGTKTPKRPAPVEPDVDPDVDPDAPPEDQPFDPFDPNPDVDPMPKAEDEDRLMEGGHLMPKAGRRIKEGFDDEVNPRIRDFWRSLDPRSRETPNHPFTKHPILRMYGTESVKRSFNDYIEHLRAAYPEEMSRPEGQRLHAVGMRFDNIMMSISRMESPYKIQLEEIAKDIVSKEFKIPKDMLIARLAPPHKTGQGLAQKAAEMQKIRDEFEREEISPQIRDQINKRITMNMLIQGAAMHHIVSIQRRAEREINEINPRFMDMYTKWGAGALHPYWMMDFSKMANLGEMTYGTCKVIYEGEEEQEQEEQEYQPEQEEQEYQPEQEEQEYQPEQEQKAKKSEGRPRKAKVSAVATCFPLLVYELIKGVVELLSHHGLSEKVSKLDKETLKKVLSAADTMHDESWMMQVGPHIWRSFLKIIPEGSDIAQTMSRFAMQDPKFVHDVISRTLEAIAENRDPSDQKEILKNMIDQMSQKSGVNQSKLKDEIDEIVDDAYDSSDEDGDDGDDESWRGGGDDDGDDDDDK